MSGVAFLYQWVDVGGLMNEGKMLRNNPWLPRAINNLEVVTTTQLCSSKHLRTSQTSRMNGDYQ